MAPGRTGGALLSSLRARLDGVAAPDIIFQAIEDDGFFLGKSAKGIIGTPL
jgi:hypothetical protein